MRERLLLLIPVTGFSCLLVLFVVLWQASQHQNIRLQGLTNRVKDLEQVLQGPLIYVQRLLTQLFQA